MPGLTFFSFICIGLFALSKCEPIKIDMLMPNVSPQEKDAYLCFAKEITGDEPIYITKFQPKSTKEIAHHILMYTCEMPGNRDEIWNCGEMNVGDSKKQQYRSGPICRGEQNIMYAWAMDAPELDLPKDVAFKLGAGTKKNYLVMQVHYANVDKFIAGGSDDSGVVLIGQTEAVSNIAGVYLTATGGYIQANSKEHFDSACEFQEDIEITPFAYRVHTHKLGQVNSGYIVRNDPVLGDAEQSWIEIGRRSPQLPQMFYPVTGNLTIRKGDTIASRCSMENNQDHRVFVGSTGNDEMCNFYIMYYTKEGSLQNNVCFRNGPPSWYFKDFEDSKKNRLQQSEIPSDISIIPDEQIEMLKVHKHSHGDSESKTQEMHHSGHKSEHMTEMENEESELNDLLNESDFNRLSKQKMISLLKELLISKND